MYAGLMVGAEAPAEPGPRAVCRSGMALSSLSQLLTSRTEFSVQLAAMSAWDALVLVYETFQ